jgi:putative Mn2+ efflux pump MntP
MKLQALLLLAFGLAMDAMAVSAARGLLLSKIRFKHVALVAGFFGGFQALMPLIGYLLGSRVGPAIQAWNNLIAFVVLSGIGVKMLWEARGGAATEATEPDPFGLKVLLLLAIATSIDALAAGFTLQLLGAPLLLSLASIGLTTAVLSGLGLFAGHRFGAALGRRLDALGGLVLIGLGVKFLVAHLRGG